MSEGLRVGIVGVGFIGTVHARAARRAGGQIEAVAASTPASAAVAAARLGAAMAFESSERLVEAAAVDVVHICTPNHLHVPLAIAALRAGKHVICEKPIALDLTEAQELQNAASEADRVFAVPFVYRYYPMVLEARDRVLSRKSGRLNLLHGSYLQDWLLTPEDQNWRVDQRLGGPSRAFADIGSHWCDLAQFVTGHRITRLSARTQIALTERRSPRRSTTGDGPLGAGHEAVATEDSVVVQFETDHGALGSFVVSQVAAGRKNRLWIEFDCASESLVFNQEEPDTLWCGHRQSTTLLQREPSEMSERARARSVLPPGHPQGYGDCFDAFIEDAYDAIRTGARSPELPTVLDGVCAVGLTQAVLDSARTEAWVEVQGGSRSAANELLLDMPTKPK